MTPFKKITIVGVGLLGGSLGLAIRKKKLAHKITGYFRNRKKIANAIKIRAIDEGTDDFDKAVSDSDLVILCSPVNDIIKKLKRLKKSKALITDIGSTKREIVKAAGHLNFVGAHPLAGSERNGIAFARGDLFKNSLCILTPGNKNVTGVLKVKKFWESLDAKIMILSAEQHDKILALTSHMPHAVAFSLITSIPSKFLLFGAGGLKDTTRIALSPPELWGDIFLSNRKELLKSIHVFESSLKAFRRLISTKDKKGLDSFLAKARQKKQSLP